ncbi:MAG: biotin synthase [Defluviitaleaceae bacterium]|nr:biotin synthase [Defluviitaleaceae bacterium]MCL2835510.1 biotin synthase [Defluviitaleaceae bacterium]
MHLQDKVWLMVNSARFDVSEEDVFFESNLSGGGCAKLPPPNKVPKVFMTNECAFNCQYCTCRRSNEERRNFVLPPKELADIAVKGAAANAAGIFLTSAVYKSPDYTQELINRTLLEIRGSHGYKGYLHAKIMPGVDERLIYEAGLLADRLSVNIELPHSSGYQTIARQKSRENILRPMGAISRMIRDLNGTQFARSQITQLMVGTMDEDDRTIITLSEAMYKKYGLKRVYYSAFWPVQATSALPENNTPIWRRNRLYQADRLLALYGMTAEELAPGNTPFLEHDIDPKTAWALRNLQLFPIEINKADYEMLLRVPGIGVTGAKRIIQARRYGRVTPEILKKMRVSLKNSRYFLTFSGKYYASPAPGNEMLRARLSSVAVRPEQLSYL